MRKCSTFVSNSFPYNKWLTLDVVWFDTQQKENSHLAEVFTLVKIILNPKKKFAFGTTFVKFKEAMIKP